ncbi:Spore germination B3/ GerAC like, C-terminal [Anoxybacillus pushchinoensis]|uniref:Spore germination B3/ GerAC like, C-terminal n=1 Tax=Anoxybacillus pushchinoensis TaxID=150248 RepID=A0A1I0SKB2_9BACL|nr:Ger(x)C family spore germination C-terminal domain-containing protein [Anoxybacillus pushchinoensis]SFA39949.1 Spore germination B3/ GerAC like, C-terminal [Anoxybacillus pushchinoensis]
MLAKEIQKQLESVVKKLQTYEVDPIGFGLYARAYEHKKFQKQKSWLNLRKQKLTFTQQSKLLATVCFNKMLLNIK